MHLAELNIGRLLAPTDDLRVKEFMDNLDRINGLGKRMPGFVWMSEGATEGAGNTENAIGDDPQLVFNLTVWEDLPSLEAFVYKTIHAKFMDRKAEWFEVLGEQHFVMWWIEEGQLPTREDALARLDDLRENGPSARVRLGLDSRQIAQNVNKSLRRNFVQTMHTAVKVLYKTAKTRPNRR